MTMCPGTGLLSQMIERGRWPAHAAGRARPGLGDPPGLGGVVAVPAAVPVTALSGSAAAAASRWQARVSSLRAIAMVAIFFPRRFAIAA